MPSKTVIKKLWLETSQHKYVVRELLRKHTNCEKTSHHMIIRTKNTAINGHEAIHAHQKPFISHRKTNQTIALRNTHANCNKLGKL